MVDVAPAVEVDERLQGDPVGDGGRGGDLLGGEEFFGGGVEGGDVGVVMFGVVEFHDLAGDGGFEGGVVVWMIPRAGD